MAARSRTSHIVGVCDVACESMVESDGCIQRAQRERASVRALSFDWRLSCLSAVATSKVYIVVAV